MTEASSTYDVVLLVEQPLSQQDALQIRSLHEEVADPVRYHLLLPVEDAAARVETAMGSLAGGEMLAAPMPALDPADVQEVQRELLDHARNDMSVCVDRLKAKGGDATGEVVSIDPVDALLAKVKAVEAAEAIILTRPHVIAEFFHLDWTSRARRKLGVPVLHLLEHENFDEQAGQGEGVSGL
jgi:hypothetical protein